MNRLIFFVLSFLLAVVPAALAVGPVDDIQVVGNSRVDTALIEKQISAKVGQEVSEATINQDIGAIYGLGEFRDVTVEMETLDGVRTLVYRVTEQPLLRQIIYEGRDDLDLEKAEKAVGLDLPMPFNPKKVTQAVESLRQAYIGSGFYTVQIDFRVDDDLPNAAELIFEIDEGAEATINSISFIGNTILSDDELRDVLETKEWNIFSWFTGTGDYIEEMVNIDIARVKNAYKDKGYLDVQVRRPSLNVSDEGEDLDLTYEIDEGLPYTVGTIDLRGQSNVPREELRALIELSAGDVYNLGSMRQSLVAINDLFADRGYANVNVSPLQQVDREDRIVNMTFAIEQGEQVYINRINIRGNETTIDKVVRRQMALQEGDLYSATKLKKSRRDVKNTGYFEEVGISTAPTDNPRYTDLNVEVTEQSTGSFTIGAGYDTADGAVASVSLTENNFFGRGYRVLASGTIGTERSTYRLAVTDPYFLDYPLTVGVEGYRSESEWEEVDRTTTGGKLKVGWELNEKWDTLFIYNYEYKEFDNVADGAAPVIQDLDETTSALSSIAALLTRDTTDYRLEPTEGGLSSISTEVAGIGGDEQFIKLNLDHRHFFSAAWDTVFAVRADFGYLWDYSDNDSPYDERFWPGGLYAIRGFGNREIGPKVGRSYVGGDVQFFTNVDYIVPIDKEAGIKGVVFFDAGNAWPEIEDTFSSFRYTAGLEVRWKSPFGPLRVGYGHKLNPRDGESSGEVLFSFGTYY